MSRVTAIRERMDEGFRHEAMLYAGEREFVERMSAFIHDGLIADEPVLVVVRGEKIGRLRGALGPKADDVMFTDMAEIGRNPGRIISAWHDFIASNGAGARRVRGIGEPIWASRTPQELVESQRHEALINLAFSGRPAWILCPYDTEALAADVIEEAYRSHPHVSQDGLVSTSDTFVSEQQIAMPFDRPLLEPTGGTHEAIATIEQLPEVRRLVAEQALGFGLEPERVGDLVLAVSEIISNSVRHGGGQAWLRIWPEGGNLLVEVRDRGRIEQPLVGRVRPASGQDGGFGLWLVNQVSDLVQIRTYPDGSVVRLHMSRTT